MADLASPMWELNRWHVLAAILLVAQTLLIAALLRHRASRRRAEAAFGERVRFEIVLSEISGELLVTPPDEIDAAIERALQRVVAFLGVDRGNVHVYESEGRTRRISWAVAGVPPLSPGLESQRFPWVVEQTRSGNVVRFSRLEELPAEAGIDRESYARTETQSHISLGLRAGGRMMGVLSFGCVRRRWVCSEELTERLRLLAEMFASALARRRAARALEERLRFETLLSELSATFVTLPTAEIDHAIEDVQRRISETLGFDRTTLWHRLSGGNEVVRTHSWSRPGLPPLLEMPTDEAYPWMLEKILRGETVVFSSVDDFPAAAARDKESLQKTGLGSAVVFPLTVGGVVFGVIAFVVQAPRAWPAPLVEQLRLVAQVFAHALMRKQAETTLRESEERFRLLADNAPVMMWMSGAEGGGEYFNQRWLDFTGRSPEDQMGDGWMAGVHPDDLPLCRDTFRRALDARRSFTREYRLRRGDGEYRWVLDHGVSRSAADGSFRGHIGSCIDTTDLKAAEEAVRRKQEELAHALRVTTMGELAASLAHEINQPLATIVTNAQASRRLLDSESLRRAELRVALTDIADEGIRAAQVITRLRALFRKEESERRALDITELVAGVASLLRHDVESKNIVVTLRLVPGLPFVSGDSIQLQQVVLNLLLNACEAIAADDDGPREVTIETSQSTADRVEVSVRDTGAGLKESELERIFEPFLTTKSAGLGMGLSISRSIMAAHGGRIWATRNPDRGITMHVELPRAEGPAAP